MSEVRNKTFELVNVTVCGQRFLELESAKAFAATCTLTALYCLVHIDSFASARTCPITAVQNVFLIASFLGKVRTLLNCRARIPP